MVVRAAVRRDRMLFDRSARSEQTDRRTRWLVAESWIVVLEPEADQELDEEQRCARLAPVPGPGPEPVEEAEMLSAQLESRLEAESESSALRDPHPHRDLQQTR